MLVTFRTKAYADVVMFGDIAVRLIKMMGHSGTVPGAILGEEVALALARLNQAVDADQASTAALEVNRAEEDEDSQAVSLANRAWPLIELLSAAARAKCDVIWE